MDMLGEEQLKELSQRKLAGLVSLLDHIHQAAGVSVAQVRQTVEERLPPLVDGQVASVWTGTETHLTVRGLDGQKTSHPYTSVSLVTAAAISNQTLNFRNARQDTRFNTFIDCAATENVRQMMVTPIRSTDNKLLGVIQVVNKIADGSPEATSPLNATFPVGGVDYVTFASSPDLRATVGDRSPSPGKPRKKAPALAMRSNPLSPVRKGRGGGPSQGVFRLPAINIGTNLEFGMPAKEREDESPIPSPTNTRKNPIGGQKRGFSSEDETVLGVVARATAASLLLATRVEDGVTSSRHMSTTEELLKNFRSMPIETDAATLVDGIMVFARDLLHAASAKLLLASEDGSELRYRCAQSDAAETKVFSSKDGIAGHVARTGETLVVPDARNDPRFSEAVDAVDSEGTRSILCAPVVWKNKVIGVMEVTKQEVDGFSVQDARLSEYVSTFCAIAMNNANLYEAAMTSKKQTELILKCSSAVASDLDVNHTIQAVMDGARELLNADRCTVFLVDQASNELYSTLADGTTQIRIPMGAGIAGHVAVTGDTCNIPEVYKDPRFSDEIDKRTGYRTNSLLCMPLYHKGEIIGVTQMINKKQGVFTEQDEKMFQVFSFFSGVSVSNAMMYDESNEAHRRTRSILEVAMIMAEEKDPGVMLGRVMEKACALVNADRFSFHLVDDRTQTLRSHVDGAKAIPLAGGLLGHVAATGEVANVTDVYDDPRFNPQHDEFEDYRTTNAIVLPVRTGDKVVGVTRIVNKQNGLFEEADIELLHAFASFCGMKIGKEPIDFGGVTAQTVEAFLHQHALSGEEKAALMTWEMQPWKYSYDKLITMLFEIFEAFDLINTFNIPRQKLYTFLVKVAKRYTSTVPYHNFMHAFDVTHAIFMYISTARLRGTFLTDINVLTMFLCAILHDVDHQGYTNSYMANTESPFALAYKNGSIMENHHVAVAISILSRQDCNLMEGMSSVQIKEVWQALIPSILATDITNREDDAAFKLMVGARSFNPESRDDRRLFMRQLIKLADISNAIRPFELAYRWADSISQEFWGQGDLEKKLGLPVLPINDRDKTTLPQMQVGFIAFVARPAFEAMIQLVPLLGPLKEVLEANFGKWGELKEKAAQQLAEKQAAQALTPAATPAATPTATPSGSGNSLAATKGDVSPSTSPRRDEPPSPGLAGQPLAPIGAGRRREHGEPLADQNAKPADPPRTKTVRSPEAARLRPPEHRSSSGSLKPPAELRV